MTDTRVAVYIDFDNIVISRYDQIHGRGQFMKDRVRGFGQGEKPADPDVAQRLDQAVVDVSAIIDFSSSFGTLVLTRAYADWSVPVNAGYRGQLVGRAVDLVQLFPAAAYAKNGADIRLAVDAVEDMFRLPDLTHVVIVAGDSDYIALAQRCRRLGRYVVGVGVAGSTSKALAAACDELVTYDALPGLLPVAEPVPAGEQTVTPPARRTRRTGPVPVEQLPDQASEQVSGQASGQVSEQPPDQAPEPAAVTGRGRAGSCKPVVEDPEGEPEGDEGATVDDESGAGDPQAEATRLLERALLLGHEKDDADWLHSSTVKNQMKRIDPSFSEKALGFRSFSDFVKSRDDIAELDESNQARLVRLIRLVPAAGL